MAVRQGIIEPVNFKMGSKQVERLCQGEEVVWRRRLIEGVDYDKIEALSAVGPAWIYTNHYPTEKTSLTVKMSVTRLENVNTNTGLMGSREGASNIFLIFIENGRTKPFFRADYSNTPAYGVNIGDLNLFEKYTLKLSHEGAFLNNTLKRDFSDTPAFTSQLNLTIGCVNTSNTLQYPASDRLVYREIIINSNNDTIRHYMPVKLKRVIPAEFTHNSQVGHVGEVGYIELVDNILYLNDNSASGSYFVEYIE